MELGKQICNLENIYGRIRTILRFEFGDENYNIDSMKKIVKSIWRFYYTAYDNRRVRDKRMKFSPAKQARRRQSILNATLTSNDPLFSSLEVRYDFVFVFFEFLATHTRIPYSFSSTHQGTRDNKTGASVWI